jgi:hypothetical protein
MKTSIVEFRIDEESCLELCKKNRTLIDAFCLIRKSHTLNKAKDTPK